MSLKISRILHAGYVFECESTQIAFDPIFENPFSRNCHAFPNVCFDQNQIKQLKLAAVFISHFHDDHCSFESLDLLDRQTPIYVYCVFEELFALIKELGFVHIHSLELDVPVVVGAIEVIPRRALDADVDSIFHIKAAGFNMLNVVDSWIDEDTLAELAKVAPWDMVLWPFQTMREIEVIAPSMASAASTELPEEWIEQLKVLNPRYIVPSSCQLKLESWSWYNQAFFPITYKQFQNEVEAALPASRVVRLNPGVSVVLDKQVLEPSTALSWVQPIGEHDVDYEYDPEVKPPPTAEIAQHFTALTVEQTARVYDYCRTGLLEKYRSMDAPGDAYFEKPRLWQLSVFDHSGDVTYFCYHVHRASIEPAPHSNQALAWSTEVPISKFHAALELGESLTSMYMRINVAGSEADIVDDPLIRCLFSSVFGAYQRAQLKRLKY